MVIYEEEHGQLTQTCERLTQDALAMAIFIVDQDGQLITSTGETDKIQDTTGLASLVAGSAAATGGLAQLMGEEEFPYHSYEGANKHLFVSIIASELVLAVIFDERSSLGLVRLRVKRAYKEMERIFREIQRRANSQSEKLDIFGEITDDDIDSLFNDTF